MTSSPTGCPPGAATPRARGAASGTRWSRRRRAALEGVHLCVIEGDLATPSPWGVFDLVLCHFVLQYRPAGIEDVARLADYVRAGGVLSVMLPNPAGMVLRQLVMDGPAAALSELQAEHKHAVTFDHEVRKIAISEMEDGLSAAGLRVARRYGTRIANDLVVDDDLKKDSEFLDRLLRLELALCDQEPFVRGGGMYQLIATKPST